MRASSFLRARSSSRRTHPSFRRGRLCFRRTRSSFRRVHPSSRCTRSRFAPLAVILRERSDRRSSRDPLRLPRVRSSASALTMTARRQCDSVPSPPLVVAAASPPCASAFFSAPSSTWISLRIEQVAQGARQLARVVAVRRMGAQVRGGGVHQLGQGALEHLRQGRAVALGQVLQAAAERAFELRRRAPRGPWCASPRWSAAPPARASTTGTGRPRP